MAKLDIDVLGDIQALGVSICFLVLITVLCKTLRDLSCRNIDMRYHTYIAEAISTFQLGAGFLEGDIIFEGCGLGVYLFFIFCMCISFASTFTGATGCTTDVWMDMFDQVINVPRSVLKIASQVGGGLCAPLLVKTFWSLALSPTHSSNKDAVSDHCQSALKSDPLSGFAIEALATLVTILIAHQRIGGVDYADYINAAVSVVVIGLGMQYTGMMFNPALATGLTGRCKDLADLDFLAVYWMGPLVGTVGAWMLTRREIPKVKIQ